MRVGSLRAWGAVAAIAIAFACAPDASGLGTAGMGMPMDPSSTGASVGSATGTTADPVVTTTAGPDDDTGEVSTSAGDAPPADSSTSAAADTSDTSDTEAPTEIERCAAPNLPIPDADFVGSASAIDVPEAGTVVEVRVVVRATHDYVGDLSFELTKDAAIVAVIDRPGAGSPHCNGNDIDVVLRDDAADTVDAACLGDGEGPPPALAGVVQPDEPLAPMLVGQPTMGAWRLRAIDHATEDQGMFTEWCLQLAYR